MVYRDVDEWRERKNETGAESDNEKRFRRFLHRLPDEITQAEDPLAAILDQHRRTEKEPDDGDGWLW